MTVVLMVAEKPSICNSIAEALSRGNHSTSGRTPPIHEFDAPFQARPAHYIVTSVVGHVFSVDFPPQYQGRESVDPLTLFRAPVQRNAEKQGIVRHLQSCGKGADYLVLWLDCDREGENICFEVIECVESKMRHLPGVQQILRAKFSAVTRPDILRAMDNLVLPNENEALSVDARQELDLKVGVAFSRFQTQFFQGKYGDLDAGMITYGPCQTPTLGFCVARHDEIRTFSPETFWTVDVQVKKEGRRVTLEWQRGRLFDQEVVCMFRSLVEAGGALRIDSVVEQEARRSRPLPLNTVELLKSASKGLGIGPHAAMQSAERLYLQGYTSYPRTESSAYPASFDIKETVGIQTSHSVWGPYAQELLRAPGGPTPARGGVDVGDHPPITPCRLAQEGELVGDMARIYELIVRHFLASVSSDAKFVNTKVKLSAGAGGGAGVCVPGGGGGGDHEDGGEGGAVVTSGGAGGGVEQFSATGRRMLDPGFTRVLPGMGQQDQLLPSFTRGEYIHPESVTVRTGQTSPPGYLTESELIGLMEKHGIGTDASIASHINNICLRNYVTIGGGRTLTPTNLGVVLVNGIQRIDPDLVLPKVRSSIEENCTLVAKGLATRQDVVDYALAMFESKYEFFVRKIELMDALFEATFSPLAATGRPLSKCGRCSRYMKYVHLKPQRLHCAECNVTYALPQGGTIKLYKELKCPLDNFELLLFSLGNQEGAMGNSYPLCPYCYNFPPFEGMNNMGCNACLHLSCAHSLTRNAICPCPGSDPSGGRGGRGGRGGGRGGGGGEEDVQLSQCPGVMVLDVNSKPNWKMGCNSCNTLIRFHGGLHTIKPSKEGRCAECGTTLLIVEFHKDKSPLEDGTTKYKGCVVCDDLLNSLTELKTGRNKHLKLTRRFGGRGRGRGRGRGGRGRGGKHQDPKMSFDGF